MSFDDPHGGSSSDEYDEKWDRPWKTNNNDKTPPAKTVDRVCMSVSSAFGWLLAVCRLFVCWHSDELYTRWRNDPDSQEFYLASHKSRVSSLLLFGISPTFSYFSTKFLLFGSWRQNFFLFSVIFLKFCNFSLILSPRFVIFQSILKISENFYSILKKMSLFLTCEIFELCSVVEIVNKATTAVKILLE